MSVAVSNQSATSIARPDTNNATYIDWQSVGEDEYWLADNGHLYSKKRTWWQHQDEINRGLKNGPNWWNGPHQSELENRDLICTISDQLGLLSRQQIAAERYFLSNNLQKWGESKVLVAVAICLFLVHSDEEDLRECHPQTPEKRRVPLYSKAIDHFGLREDRIVSTYGKVNCRYPKPKP